MNLQIGSRKYTRLTNYIILEFFGKTLIFCAKNIKICSKLVFSRVDMGAEPCYGMCVRTEKDMKKEKLVIRIFQLLMLCAVVFGSVREADLVWKLGDIGVGLMAWFTVISIFLLAPKAIEALKDFEKDN